MGGLAVSAQTHTLPVPASVYAVSISSIQEMIVNDVHCYLPLFFFCDRSILQLWRVVEWGGESLWKQTPWQVSGVQP